MVLLFMVCEKEGTASPGASKRRVVTLARHSGRENAARLLLLNPTSASTAKVWISDTEGTHAECDDCALWFMSCYTRCVTLALGTNAVVVSVL